MRPRLQLQWHANLLADLEGGDVADSGGCCAQLEELFHPELLTVLCSK